MPKEILSSTMSKEEVQSTIEQLSSTLGIAFDTATRAAAHLFRKGAANARAKYVTTQIECQVTKRIVTVSKYDIEMALHRTLQTKNVRKLAEAMAPDIIEGNLAIAKRVPTAELSGDLAQKINRKLLKQAQNTAIGITPPPPLTLEEEICCCTYAQWMPNLNDLANSNRLKALLEEDYAESRTRRTARKKSTKKGNQTKVKVKVKEKEKME
jgi:hypothetical protein